MEAIEEKKNHHRSGQSILLDEKGSVSKSARPRKTRIDIYKAWCKACGICVAFCPTGALAKDEAGYPYVKDIEKCINCGWCEIRCPDFAITVEQKTKDKKKVETKDGEKETKGEEETSTERIVASGE